MAENKTINKFQMNLKRLIDIFGSLFGIIFIFIPFYLPIAIAIKLSSKGPILIKLKRISQGKQIDVYKFRTMAEGSKDFKVLLASLNERSGPFFKIKEDPRITKIGKILRRFRLDELPQFFNVLKGELSLVGPRPHEPQEIFFYPNKYHDLILARGGLTGLAQINGASSLPFFQELEIDSHYLKNWSLKLDLYIILKTALSIFNDKNSI